MEWVGLGVVLDISEIVPEFGLGFGKIVLIIF